MSYDLPAPFIPYTRAHGRCGAAPHYSDVRQAQRAGYSCEQRDIVSILIECAKDMSLTSSVTQTRTLPDILTKASLLSSVLHNKRPQKVKYFFALCSEFRMYVIIETVRTLGHYHYDNHSMKVSKHS